MQQRLALNSRSSYPHLPSAGKADVYHHTQPFGNFKMYTVLATTAAILLKGSLEHFPLTQLMMCALLGLSPRYTDPHLGGCVLHITSSNDSM